MLFSLYMLWYLAFVHLEGFVVRDLEGGLAIVHFYFSFFRDLIYHFNEGCAIGGLVAMLYAVLKPLLVVERVLLELVALVSGLENL